MAKNFATSYVLPYKGLIRSQPVKFCDGANAVVIDLPWRAYGIDLGSTIRTYVNPGVRIGWSNSPTLILDGVQGVYIDNTDCDSPVYLRAEDTGHMVVCPDGSAGFFPILTNGSDFVAYVESIAAPYEKLQMTKIILCDKPFPPTSDPQFNEFIPASQVSGSQSYANEVQGDQLYSLYTDAMTSFSVTAIPAVANTTIVIKEVLISSNVIRAQANSLCNASIRQTGKILEHEFWVNPDGNFANNPFVGNAPFQLSNMSVRLPGNLPILFQVSISAGTGWQARVGLNIVYARLVNPTT